VEEQNTERGHVEDEKAEEFGQELLREDEFTVPAGDENEERDEEDSGYVCRSESTGGGGLQDGARCLQCGVCGRRSKVLDLTALHRSGRPRTQWYQIVSHNEWPLMSNIENAVLPIVISKSGRLCDIIIPGS
jgi:hypothetical protein